MFSNVYKQTRTVPGTLLVQATATCTVCPRLACSAHSHISTCYFSKLYTLVLHGCFLPQYFLPQWMATLKEEMGSWLSNSCTVSKTRPWQPFRCPRHEDSWSHSTDTFHWLLCIWRSSKGQSWQHWEWPGRLPRWERPAGLWTTDSTRPWSAEPRNCSRSPVSATKLHLLQMFPAHSYYRSFKKGLAGPAPASLSSMFFKKSDCTTSRF